MSTKSTMILTGDNEHWYLDCNGPYYEKTKTQRCIVLELDPRHKIEQDDEGTRVIIEEGTPLYNTLENAFFSGPVRFEILP